MKKICIVTFSKIYNYGALFQSYALFKFLKDNEFTVNLLNYSIINVKVQENNILRKFIKLIKRIYHRNNNLIKANKFIIFQKENMLFSLKEYKGNEQIESYPPDYDVFVSGSDQIWNSNITNGDKTFFLNFTKRKKIAYAASFGKDYLTQKEKENVIAFLPDYNYISVRESSAKELLESFNIKSQVVLDPVFLIDKAIWSSHCTNNIKILKDYIFVYSMENSKSLEMTTKIMKKKYNIPVIVVRGGGQPGRIDGKEDLTCGPAEFLRYIRDAKYIVTNSFHGLAFSIIFEKKFICLPHSTRNTRIENLMCMIEKIDYMVQNDDGFNSIEKYIVDGQEAFIRIKEYIKKSKQFLLKAINDEHNK